ncbi:MAG: hypothetical protein Q4Q03_02575 [Bowdeniella nasicola]|nr:hypothetical protein [Bowdeniella nasicola]
MAIVEQPPSLRGLVADTTPKDPHLSGANTDMQVALVTKSGGNPAAIGP